MAKPLNEKKYNQSQKVKDAFDNYNNFKNNNKPKDYTFSDADTLSDIQNQYLNHPDFSYNVNSDPIFHQYKQIYKSQGKKAMEDSVGNVSALSGGYGNSYAQTAGMNAYYSEIDKLNNIIPELYSAAYSRYENELDRLENKLGLLSDKDKEEYSRYIDNYNLYTDEVDSLRELYLKEYENDIDIQDSEWEAAYKIAMKEQAKELADADMEYKYYMAKQNQSQFDAENAYKYYLANLNQAQFNADLEYKKYVSEQNNINKQKEYDLQQQKINNDKEQFWADYDYKTKQSLREDEFFVILGNEGPYEALAALDMEYTDDEMVRYKAIAMGIDTDYIDSYFDAKNKGGN